MKTVMVMVYLVALMLSVTRCGIEIPCQNLQGAALKACLKAKIK